jgi:DNA (cytosine-5)-methyltransferase 1
MGWDNVFHCEVNPFGQRVLKYYWPEAELFEDITKTDFTKYANRIDVLSGGFPCQPYSTAGKRLGKEDERHLWPEMLRAIREIKPRWIVGENVSGLISWNGGMVFNEVQTDLEAEGYEVIPFVLPACGVNAPHRRDRVWFVAQNTHGNGWGGVQRQSKSGIGGFGDTSTGDHEWVRANHDEIGDARHPKQSGLEGGIRSSGAEGFKQGCEKDDATHTGGIESQGGMYQNGTGTAERYSGSCNPRINGGTTWDDFPTQPPVRGRNDGFSPGLLGITLSKHRQESIKAYGNAVVPQVVMQIFKAIEQYEINPHLPH